MLQPAQTKRNLSVEADQRGKKSPASSPSKKGRQFMDAKFTDQNSPESAEPEQPMRVISTPEQVNDEAQVSDLAASPNRIFRLLNLSIQQAFRLLILFTKQDFFGVLVAV